MIGRQKLIGDELDSDSSDALDEFYKVDLFIMYRVSNFLSFCNCKRLDFFLLVDFHDEGFPRILTKGHYMPQQLVTEPVRQASVSLFRCRLIIQILIGRHGERFVVGSTPC